MLPGIDDGASDLATALAMARMALADGITHVACTPHVTPGVYDNSAANIDPARAALSLELAKHGIELVLLAGADIHAAPNLASRLAQKEIPSLGGSRYFLFEPPHDVAPPGLDRLVTALVAAGHVPVLTHPERLGWIETHYNLVDKLIAAGTVVQLTAHSITGDFGRRPKYWSERMLDEGVVDIVATDAHNLTSRPPVLSRARDAVAARLGEAEALNMVRHRPAAILENTALPPRARQIVPQSRDKAPMGNKGLLPWLKKLRG